MDVASRLFLQRAVILLFEVYVNEAKSSTENAFKNTQFLVEDKLRSSLAV